LGTSLVCEKCGREIEEQQKYEHLGRSYCEDCYMDILSPPKACDPWAVYSARSSLQGADKFAALTPPRNAASSTTSGPGVKLPPKR
jgi:DNA-directed RNA polymerase subunit RPC12/RpoP